MSDTILTVITFSDSPPRVLDDQRRALAAALDGFDAPALLDFVGAIESALFNSDEESELLAAIEDNEPDEVLRETGRLRKRILNELSDALDTFLRDANQHPIEHTDLTIYIHALSESSARYDDFESWDYVSLFSRSVSLFPAIAAALGIVTVGVPDLVTLNRHASSLDGLLARHILAEQLPAE